MACASVITTATEKAVCVHWRGQGGGEHPGAGVDADVVHMRIQ